MDHLNSSTAGMIYRHVSVSGKGCRGLTSNLLSVPLPVSRFPDDVTEYQLHFRAGSCPEHIFCPLLCVAMVTRQETSANRLLCWSRSGTVVSVACLRSTGAVCKCQDKPAYYPEVLPSAILNYDINFSTSHGSVSAEDSKMDPMFDILHGNSLFPVTFPKRCWNYYSF